MDKRIKPMPDSWRPDWDKNRVVDAEKIRDDSVAARIHREQQVWEFIRQENRRKIRFHE